jgi:hypothetical protein
MCFSAPASFISGAALSAAGAAAARKARGGGERSFALVPLFFGIQQLIEGLVWLSFSSSLAVLNTVSTYAFSFFAFVFWPVYVPFAVAAMETNVRRKRLLKFFQLTGLAVGGYFLYAQIADPVVSSVVEHHIVYHNPRFHEFSAILLYFAATIGSCLLSSRRVIRLFGIAVLVCAFFTSWFYYYSFVSVWCFFAAILSCIVLWYFYRGIRATS